MKDENKLLKELSNYSFDLYEIEPTIDVTSAIQLKCFEDLIKFAQRHSVGSLFYCYYFIDSELLIIDDDTIKKLYLNDDVLSVMQIKFDKYNDEVSQLDFSNPVSLYVYCVYEGFVYFICEDDYWFLEQGFSMPENAAMRLIGDSQEELVKQKEQTKEIITQKRNNLREQILNDEGFHQCTNEKLRRVYTDRLFRDNEEYGSLFYQKKSGLYDIPVNYFIEEVWKEYKQKKK